MDRSVAEQTREVKDMLRRAQGTPDRHGSLRRETFRRLIDLAHSDDAALKILSAENIRFFLTDFPDWEEAAIDAIYDLCEDSSSKVRIEGYAAITQVSRVQSKWIKRNADVLVQLLQSEEADEVVVVKKALTEHLDMDPKITLGVLCDQIIPRDDTADEEEISIRERLRTLVLAFMAGEAKLAICERHAIPGAAGEAVLYEGLFAAIPRLGIDDLQLIIKDLVFALPPFKNKRPNKRGSELLQLLLSEKVTSALKADLHSAPTNVSLATTRPLLEMCEQMTCVLQAAPAINLLQFHCTALIGKMILQKMKLSEQEWIVCGLARVLDVAEKQDQGMMRLPPLRRTIVDACPYLLEVLKKSNLSEPKTISSYGVFLRACLQRTKESSWTVPPNLLGILQELNKQPGISQNEEYERVIRSLAPPSQQSQTALAATSLKTPPSTSNPHTPSTLPSQPSRPANINPHPSMSRSVHTQIISPVQDATRIKRDTATEIPTTRPIKRPKVDEVFNSQKGPSLLSRLGTTISRQSSRSDLSSRTQSASPKPEGDPSSQPGHGLSIKGAAAKQARQNGSPNSGGMPSSLLERLQDPHPRAPTGGQHQQPDIGRKRRNF